jgi:hypothetical protein
MPGNQQIVFLLLAVWIPVFLHSQEVPPNTQDMEDLHYRDESSSVPERTLQEYQDLIRTPLDLNTASRDELEASGLFSSFQVYNLLKYRSSFGAIYSIYELLALPGFNPACLDQIAPCIVLDSELVPEGKFKGSHMLLVTLERSFPLEDSYLVSQDSGDNSLYAGSALNASLRFRSHPLKKVTMALTYEKDAGELFLYQKKPQFLSAYLNYKGKGFMKQLVLGTFQMNQGLGLVNGSGFIHRAGDFRVNRQSLSRIRPYASLTESMFEQGVACKMGTRNLQLLIWASYHKLSLSPAALSENPGGDKWLDFQRTSGYYRNRSEMEGRDLAFRIHTGLQVLYTNQNLTVGVLNGTEWIGATKKALVQLTETPRPPPMHKLSLHGNWSKHKFQLFGELSANEYKSLAVLFGGLFHFSDFVHGSLLLHHYGAEYHGSLPSSYGSGSAINNERGLAFNLHVETGKVITAELTAEVFRYPMPRYLTSVPSGACRLDLSLQNAGKQLLEWKVRLYTKAWQSTPSDENFRIRPLQDHRVNRLDGQLVYNHLNRFRWLSRLVIGYSSKERKPAPAYAAVQQVTLVSPGKLRLSVQFVLFQVDAWENRIYLYEPGLYYSFNFPLHYGSGQRTTLLFTCKPVSGVTVSSKLSVSTNAGENLWDAGIQLRLSL